MFAVRPVSVVDADVGEATRVEVEPWTRYTSYPASPLPPESVDAAQVRVAPVWVIDDAAGVPGTVGAVVSVAAVVVNVTADRVSDDVPGESLARTA